MDNKDKIIKEMAKDIPYLTLDRTVFVGATETKNVSWTLSEEDNKVIAESLVAKGYRKITDSVVLSKEELNEIIKQTKETEKNYYKRVVIPQERKETTEKFLQLAYDRSLEKSFIKKVEELAKSLGVEIKE